MVLLLKRHIERVKYEICKQIADLEKMNLFLMLSNNTRIK